jgi:hypothetical protein
VTVHNGITNTKLTSSDTTLLASSASQYDGLIFYRDSDGAESPGYGFNGGPALDALRTAIAKFIPAGNSYVSAVYRPDVGDVVPDEYYFSYGRTNDSRYNFVQGLYQHSDDLQVWTENMAKEITNSFAKACPAPETAEFDGEALITDTFFEVRWCKLTLSPRVSSCTPAHMAVRLDLASSCRPSAGLRIPYRHNHPDTSKTGEPMEVRSVDASICEPRPLSASHSRRGQDCGSA